MAPITKLMKMIRPFIGTLECQHAWDMIKKCYIETPMVISINWQVEFHVLTIASLLVVRAMEQVFKKKWYGPYTIQYLLFNNVALLVTLGKFEPNRMSTNVSKLKPHKYVDQLVSKPIVNQNQSRICRNKQCSKHNIGN